MRPLLPPSLRDPLTSMQIPTWHRLHLKPLEITTEALVNPAKDEGQLVGVPRTPFSLR
jgi:hypothetical protein